MDSTATRPLIVHIDHAEPLIAAGALHALLAQPGIDVRPADTGPADVVIADYRSGLRLAAEARTRPPRPGRPAPTRLMVVTVHDREHEVRQALESGVHGYLLTSCHTEELVRCVRALGNGARYLCMTVAQRMADSLTRESLTSREVDVLRLLARGQCNKAIATDLDIAVGTVKAHVKAIMGKLDARSRTHAVTVAAGRGLVDDTLPHDSRLPEDTGRPFAAVAFPQPSPLAS